MSSLRREPEKIEAAAKNCIKNQSPSTFVRRKYRQSVERLAAAGACPHGLGQDTNRVPFRPRSDGLGAISERGLRLGHVRGDRRVGGLAIRI